MEKHGMSNSRLYRVWQGMRGRCYCPSNTSYKFYGARRVTVCEEWSKFIPFMNWALSTGYKQGKSIERIDGTQAYSPNNCKWIPLSQQAKNRRDTIHITYNGKTMCLKDWAREIGITRQSLTRRLTKHSVEKALTL
jgi:hypothetical protein